MKCTHAQGRKRSVNSSCRGSQVHGRVKCYCFTVLSPQRVNEWYSYLCGGTWEHSKVIVSEGKGRKAMTHWVNFVEETALGVAPPQVALWELNQAGWLCTHFED